MGGSGGDGARGGAGGDVWETAARGGFAVSGLLHLALGLLIARVGLGADAEADQSAVIAQVGDSPLGVPVLVVAAIAFVALAAWQVADALRGRETSERLRSGAKALLYGALAFTVATVTAGARSSGGDGQAEGFAGALMQAPGGRLLVGLVGLGILAGAGYHAVKGATRSFMEDLRPLPGRELGAGVRWLGTVGYLAKAVALAVIGALFVLAAATADPDKAAGLDGGVEWLLTAPGGPLAVVLVGAGFAAYGAYSLARARYARM